MKKCFGVFLLLAACSNSNGGSASLSGNGAFTVTAQFAGPSIVLGIPGASGGVLMGNVDPSPTCSQLLDGGDTYSTGKAVSIVIFPADGGAVSASTYNLVDPRSMPTGSYAYVGLELLNDGGPTLLAISNSGTLTLTGVGSSWVGQFQSQMTSPGDGGSMGTLAGSFDAPVCNP